jgi:MEMO1 family protein
MATQLREPAVAGLFYEQDPLELQSQLEALFAMAEKTIQQDRTIMALVVPHAGYTYSGKVAAMAYAALPKSSRWEHIFIIGSSHRAHFKGAALCKSDGFNTPLGVVRIDKEMTTTLTKSTPLFQNNVEVHSQEHSIEVQLPFLQYWLERPFKITPILLGTQSPDECEAIARALKPFFTPNNLFIISSDFSHYPCYDDAVTADEATANAIISKKPQTLLAQLYANNSTKYHNLQTSLCGWTSALTLLYMTEAAQDIAINKITYQNSGDASIGDKSRVVGYWALSANIKPPEATFHLSDDEKKQLLNWSRHCLAHALGAQTEFNTDLGKMNGIYQENAGVFVTLYKNKQLRGCIGNFNTDKPLWKSIKEMTLAAAFDDYRFENVGPSELHDIEIEISVLSPLRPIKSHNEIVIGKHGVYLKKGNRTATFLPQVATHHKWAVEDLLGHLSADKAGMGWDDWKTSQLWVYESLVFREDAISTTTTKP